MKCFPKNDLVKFWNLVVGTSRVAHPTILVVPSISRLIYLRGRINTKLKISTCPLLLDNIVTLD